MLAAHLATGECEASCRRCKQSDDCRAVWGCDAPTPQPWFELECPRCAASDPNCTLCRGAGRIGIDRCPNVTIPEVYRVATSAALESDEGAWPESGGVLDQSAWFVAARNVVLGVVDDWRKRSVNRGQ